MDFRRLLPDVKPWTLREIACAAGLVAASAAAGYCIYRSLRGGSAPPDHTQPPHEPEDELEATLDTLSALQVVELNLQLLPTEPCSEPPAVLDVVDVQPAPEALIQFPRRPYNQDSTEAELFRAQVVELSLQLLPTKPCSEPPAVVLDVVDVQPAPEALIQFLRRPYNQDSTEAELFRAQVLESNLQLLPFEPHHEASAVVLPLDAGELISAWCDVQFLSADYCGSQFGSVLVKRYFLRMIRGHDSRLCWFKTTETRYLNDEGFPYHSITEDSFTAIQVALGRVTEFISCNRVEDSVSMTLDYLQTFKKVTCTYLHMGADDRVEITTWVQENVEDSPCSDSESQPDFEESFTPEEMEVPFISSHLADRGVTGIGMKLCALRQAFSTLLASIHNKNFLFVVGKKIVMELAAANNQNAVGMQLAYESLIQFLRRPCNEDWIKAELSGAEIHHYNFVDVFFELLVFGRFTNGSAPEAFEGGFLERLFALLGMWDVEEWEPAAGTYFTVLIEHLTALCEVLFSQPMELYSDPAALASTVLSLLRQHIKMMMDDLERL